MHFVWRWKIKSNIIFDDLPDDTELSQYYVLGACANYHHDLQHILMQTNISDYTSSPEQADKLAEDFSIKLQYQCLQQKLKSKKFTSIAEMRNLKQRIYEIDRKRSLTLIDE